MENSKKDKYGYKVGYRIKWEDKPEYETIKKFVVEDLHSDMCFIQWSLLRAFFYGLSKKPNINNTFEIKFPRQNIQMNIGCTINYNRLKARRLPPKEPPLELRKDYLLPLLLEEWSTLSEAKKTFWRERLKENGIIYTSDSCQKPEKNKNFFQTLLKYCLTIVSKLLKMGLDFIERFVEKFNLF
jgi:hypothetical protein